MKALWVAVFLISTALPAGAACRLALALALDVSGSVDDREYRLQLSGLAAALGDEDVRAALLAMPDAPVALAVFEWSSTRYQRIVHDWVQIKNESVLDDLRAHLLSWQREAAPEATGLGASMEYGAALMSTAPGCWKRTLDISGDGKNNDWPSPVDVRKRGSVAGLRINGLVIAPDPDGAQGALGADELAAYFRARVIQGPDAFVEVAYGYSDYPEAMRRKLLREIQALPIGALPPGTRERRPGELRLASDQ